MKKTYRYLAYAFITSLIVYIFATPWGATPSDVEQVTEQKSYTVETVPNTRLSSNNNYVSNPDTIISFEAEKEINTILANLEAETGVQTAVVVLSKITSSMTDRQFATALFEEWGIGSSTKDDGLLVLLITDPNNRKITFETGYGLEGILPDAICKRIQMESMVPLLKENKFSEGMVAGIKAVYNRIALPEENDANEEALNAQDTQREMTEETETPKQAEVDTEFTFWEMTLLVLIVVVILAFVVLGPLGFILFIFFIITAPFTYFWKRRKQKCPSCNNKTYRFISSETILKATYSKGGEKKELYTCPCGYEQEKIIKTSKIKKYTSSSPYSSSSSSSSSSSGGSWGGGRSGGGGASSSF